jgi:hypothetical protein
MKFTEEKLEHAAIKLFESEDYKHLSGKQIHKEMPGMLPPDYFKQYLLNRYSKKIPPTRLIQLSANWNSILLWSCIKAIRKL